MDASKLPPVLKPISAYLKVANEYDKRDPVVSYFCEYIQTFENNINNNNSLIKLEVCDAMLMGLGWRFYFSKLKLTYCYTFIRLK